MKRMMIFLVLSVQKETRNKNLTQANAGGGNSSGYQNVK